MSSNKNKNPLYFIALIPPADIRKEVENLKKEINRKFGLIHALKLEAHITLQIPFRMKESKENILVKKIQKFSVNHHSINTRLDGFGRFAKNVVFIEVFDHDPFIKLHAELQEFMLNFIELKSHEISSKIHPHITLATRDLKRSHFPEIWEYIQEKKYSTSVKFEIIRLLKHNGKVWIPVQNFTLSG
ncbi:2'-5' RNA ligase family protein [Gramella lutea]|uniref:2'-5' RNA ligase family protein n=1 Tax=Christiangramia lutea TaxID=1607951 RepID=A0A9X1V543_9FLAO|nr:2'-5' RNA ligase family protein [Christiangramia lutea]MCH4824251.1 2'-5' RNA ligase family protein [Christiangramia lutea]